MGWSYSHIDDRRRSFHTAFIVFGAQRLWAFGPWAVVPWILPTVVGIPAIVISRRHYQRKFNTAPAGAVA